MSIVVPQLRIERPPQTDNELWWMLVMLFGIRIPRKKVCPHHCAPFQAVADAHFARSRVSLWKASRALGGKTTMLGILALSEAVLLGSPVFVLGGSGAQSARVLDVIDRAMTAPYAPRHLLESEPGEWKIKFKDRVHIEAVMASQASVRGHHEPRVRLDEVDEMDVDVMKAAFAVQMPMPGIKVQTVLSSTHQYPDGAMTEALKLAVEKGWPVYEWCYKDTLKTDENPDGWLPVEEMEGKKQDMPAAQWAMEVELQEPAAENRAIQPDAVEKMFQTQLGVGEGAENEYLEFALPTNSMYATGADWGKAKDWTVIVTFDASQDNNWRLVAFRAVRRRNWDVMIGYFNERVLRYPGVAGHDAVGLGDVVHDQLKGDIEEFKMMGAPRQELFTEYIVAIERGYIKSPRIKWMYNEHRLCTTDMLYGAGHPPDSVVAAAIAWRQRHRVPRSDLMPAGVGGRTAHLADW